MIFLSEHARAIKKMDKIEESTVQNYFKHPNLKVIRTKEDLQNLLQSKNWTNCNLLMMSSGTFDGIAMHEL